MSKSVMLLVSYPSAETQLTHGVEKFSTAISWAFELFIFTGFISPVKYSIHVLHLFFTMPLICNGPKYAFHPLGLLIALANASLIIYSNFETYWSLLTVLLP